MNSDVKKLAYELNLIKSDKIRGIVGETLANAPDYFWTASASSTGLHHPPEELKEGGSLLHVRKTVKVVIDLCRAFRVEGLERDYVIAAMLLHDICKFGYPNHCGQLVAGHGYLVAQVMRDAEMLKSDTPDPDVKAICRLASTHMGRWDAPFDPPTISTLPSLIHLADYFVSRAYVKVELDES